MSWNYRIMKREISENEFEFGIYEVYYNENGKINGWTEESIVPVVDNKEGLKSEVVEMLKAFNSETILYTRENK